MAQRIKHLPSKQETWVQSPVGKIPWRRKWQPTPVFLPGKSHGQRSLEGYSPWGPKGLDTTKHARSCTHTQDTSPESQSPHRCSVFIFSCRRTLEVMLPSPESGLVLNRLFRYSLMLLISFTNRFFLQSFQYSLALCNIGVPKEADQSRK